jgi:hypothetical protein
MQATLSQKQAEYLDLLKQVEETEAEQIISGIRKIAATQKSTANSVEDDLVTALTGRTYSTYSNDQKIKLEMEALFQYFQKRKQLLETALTAPQVAELLGTSRQTPHDRVKSKSLLGVLDKGALRFPAWQFDPEGPDGVIDGLPEVLKTIAASDFAKLNWLVRPNPFLDGLTPLQLLKQGNKERVIREAIGIGEASW